MKSLQIMFLLAAGVVCLSPSIAAADTLDTLDFTYTDAANGNLTATGTLIFDATTGYVINGSGTVDSSLFVTPGSSPPTEIGPQSMTLFTAANYASMTARPGIVGGGVYQVQDSDGTNLTFDNLFNPAASPNYSLDNNGLLFAVGDPNSYGDYDSFNIFSVGGVISGSLNDFLGAGGVPGDGQVWSQAGPGTLTITLETTTNSAATPLPAALPLFATGLGALGLFGWRRKRKAQAATT